MSEMGIFFRHSKTMAKFKGSFKNLALSSVSLIEKEAVVREIEAIIEQKFLQYCDPGIPVQILLRRISRIGFGRIRLATRHPCHYPTGVEMRQEEKEKVFAICLDMIEQENALYQIDYLRRFHWFIDHTFQVDALVYLINELRHNFLGPLVDRAWANIAAVFDHHPPGYC